MQTGIWLYTYQHTMEEKTLMHSLRACRNCAMLVAGITLTFLAGSMPAFGAPDSGPQESEMEKEEKRRRVKVIDLEGQQFSGMFGAKDSTAGKPLTIAVSQTRWTSSYGTEHGYATSSYGAYIRNDTTYVQLQQSSRKLRATLEWNATIEGDSLNGTITQFIDGVPPKIMWIKTRRIAAPPASNK